MRKIFALLIFAAGLFAIGACQYQDYETAGGPPDPGCPWPSAPGCK